MQNEQHTKMILILKYGSFADAISIWLFDDDRLTQAESNYITKYLLLGGNKNGD